MSLFKSNIIVIILIYFSLSWADESVKSDDLPEEVIPELYEKYRDVVQYDSETVSLRRVFSNNEEYQLHVEKLKAVNGFKRHNIMIKKRNVKRSGDKEEIIYITNPVETKIPNAFLTLEDFKTVLTDRVKEQKEEFKKMVNKKINVNKLPNFHNKIKKKIKNNRSTRRVIKNYGNSVAQITAKNYYTYVTKTLGKFIDLKEKIDNKVVGTLADISGITLSTSEEIYVPSVSYSKVENVTSRTQKGDQKEAIEVTPKAEENSKNKSNSESSPINDKSDEQNTQVSTSEVLDTTIIIEVSEITTENNEAPTEITNATSENSQPSTKTTDKVDETTQTIENNTKNTLKPKLEERNTLEIRDVTKTLVSNSLNTFVNLRSFKAGNAEKDNDNAEESEVTEAESETTEAATKTTDVATTETTTETTEVESETTEVTTKTTDVESETTEAATETTDAETETETTTEETTTTTKRKKLSRPLVFMGSGFDRRRRVLE